MFEDSKEGQTNSCPACIEFSKKMSNLLKLIGNASTCGSAARPGCGQPIYWTVTREGKKTPLNPDGTTHFATCPKANEFRRQKVKERHG